MKRFPECRRDYYDDTLSFCLDDGSRRLLGGPAAFGVSPSESWLYKTGILSADAKSGAGGNAERTGGAGNGMYSDSAEAPWNEETAFYDERIYGGAWGWR